jgi:transcriptional regulator with XRE-family HTH domain
LSFGAKLKELRAKHNKSLQQVADAIGASKAHIWDLERGESKNPSLELILKLAKFFDIGVADLVGERPNAHDEPDFAALYRDVKELSPEDRETIRVLAQRLKTAREDK